ncbi:MAG: class IV adenylate cyclase [Methanobacteriota archaeon]
MLEIEAKARVSNQGKIKSKLIELGAKFLKKEEQEDIYFDHPARDFAKSDEALRIRKIGKDSYLTYKGPKLDKLTKTREEHEFKFSGFEEAKEILKKLKFREVATIRKQREYYALQNFIIALDEVEDLGSFIEVEKKAGHYTPEEIIAFLKKLGVEDGSIERRSYLELILKS